jgi:hypothetical protein
MASDNRQSEQDLYPEIEQLLIECKKTDQAEIRIEELRYKKARTKTAFMKTRS